MFIFALLATTNLNAKTGGGNAQLPDSMPLNEASYVMAHNAHTAGWLFYKQQNHKIKKLFNEYGVRAAKIRLDWYKNPITRSVSIRLCHESDNVNNCKLTPLQRGKPTPEKVEKFFEPLAEVLTANPDEIFILKLEDRIYAGSSQNGKKEITNKEASEALDKIIEKTGLYKHVFQLKDEHKIPTFGDLRKSGKKLIIFDFERLANHSLYTTPFESFVRQTHWEDKHFEACDMVCGNNEKAPFFEMSVNPEVSLPSNTVIAKFISLGSKLIDFLKVSSSKIYTTNYSKVNSSQNIIKRVEKCVLRQADQKYPIFIHQILLIREI